MSEIDRPSLTHDELHRFVCTKGGKHNIFIGMTNDMKPQFCILCGAWSNEYPPDSEMEDL